MADSSSADDRLDLDRRELLAVTGPTNVVLATTKLEDDELVAEALLDDLGRDLRPRHRRSSDRHVLALARSDEQHLVKRDLGARVAFELLDPEGLAGLCPVLLAACLDHRVHV